MIPKPRFELFAASCTPDGGVFRYTLSNEGKLTRSGGIPMDRPMYFQKIGDRLHVILRAPDGFGGSGAYVACDAYGSEVDLSDALTTNGIVPCHLSV